MADYVSQTIANDPGLTGKYNVGKYRAAYDAILNGEWTETSKDYQAVTEIFADFIANEVLSNEDSARRLAQRDRNLLVRIYEWVKDAVRRLKMSKADRASYDAMRKMERLLESALEAGKGGISLEEVEKNIKRGEQLRKAENGNVQSVKFGETIDNKSAVGYNKAQARASIKKTPYIQWKSDALAWANSKRTNIGDMNIGADSNYYYFYEAIDAYNEGSANDYKVIAKVGQSNQQLIDELSEEVKTNNERSNESIHKRVNGYKIARNKNQGNSTAALGESSRDGYVGGLHRTESRSNGKRNNKEGGRSEQNVVKHSANPIDTAYANIVKSGNMGKAQKLVEEAAKGWGAISLNKQHGIVVDGTPTILYHGTSNYGFTTFKTRLPGAMEGTDAIFMSVDEFTASEYKNGEKGGIYKLYAKIANPLVVDCNGTVANSILLKQGTLDLARKYVKDAWEHVDTSSETKFSTDQIAYAALRSGKYDGVVFENVIDSYRDGKKTTDVVVFNANQVKSAEPATYDDNGNLIPLSKRFNKKSADIRYSLPVDVETDVKKHYGSTYNWKETGYILQDGTRLDLSGRNEGARGGYRTVDHRDIFDIIEDADIYGTEAMNEFIARGNIRVMPENPGINLQVEPNEEQYRLIQDFVERVGWKEGYFSVDIDNEHGDTIETLTYEGRPSGRKVVADLKYYFKEGKLPYKSELSAFRYSIDVDNFDFSEYNEIQLPVQECNRVQSEALKWKNKRNIPLKLTLSNEYTYLCRLDDNAEIHIYKKEKIVNVHEDREYYVKRNKERLDTSIEGVRIKRESNDRDYYPEQDRRNSGAVNTGNNRQVRRGRQSDRTGYNNNGIHVDRTQERKRIVYFDDSNNERYSIDVDARLRNRAEILRRYMYSINIAQETKDALQEKYGKETAKRIINIWDNTSGKTGVDMPTVAKEIYKEMKKIDSKFGE